MDSSPLELQTGSGTSPKEKSVLQTANIEGQSHQNTLTLDTELQDLEFSQLAFGLSSVHYFLTISLSLSFGMVMYIMYHCMSQVFTLLIDLQDIEIKRLP